MSPKGRIRRKRKYIYVNDTRTLTILLALGGWGHAMRPSNGGVPDWLYNFILAETSRQGSRPRRWRLDTKSRLEFRRWSERNCKIIYTIHFIDWFDFKNISLQSGEYGHPVPSSPLSDKRGKRVICLFVGIFNLDCLTLSDANIYKMALANGRKVGFD